MAAAANSVDQSVTLRCVWKGRSEWKGVCRQITSINLMPIEMSLYPDMRSFPFPLQISVKELRDLSLSWSSVSYPNGTWISRLNTKIYSPVPIRLSIPGDLQVGETYRLTIHSALDGRYGKVRASLFCEPRA